PNHRETVRVLLIPAVAESGPELGGFIAGAAFVAFSSGSKFLEKRFGILFGFEQGGAGLRTGNTIHRDSERILEDADRSGGATIESGIPQGKLDGRDAGEHRDRVGVL